MQSLIVASGSRLKVSQFFIEQGYEGSVDVFKKCESNGISIVRYGQISDIAVDSQNKIHILTDTGLYQQYTLNQPTKSQKSVELEPLTIDMALIPEKHNLKFDRIALNI